MTRTCGHRQAERRARSRTTAVGVVARRAWGADEPSRVIFGRALDVDCRPSTRDAGRDLTSDDGWRQARTGRGITTTEIAQTGNARLGRTPVRYPGLGGRGRSRIVIDSVEEDRRPRGQRTTTIKGECVTRRAGVDAQSQPGLRFSSASSNSRRSRAKADEPGPGSKACFATRIWRLA